ncbi:hypothetical protein [Stutzerimonas nitrititolerans]|uniref:hypothetical protein n=1 Tax=Stutzerimonas nitrititolerans TaxID=2482751 RepID=UPI0028B10473|nr:hypothetical protein [Stutzerimonas nitrititolerans]
MLNSAAALRAAQFTWDNTLPAEDDGHGAYIEVQVSLLLAGQDAEQVSFYAPRSAARPGYAETAMESVLDADDDSHPLLLMLLAALRGDHAAAQKLAERFEPQLISTATTLIERALEARRA